MISGPPLAHVQGLRVAGILGGMSWESTATYYRLINQEYNRRLGGYHSAPVIIHSVDFAPIEAMQRAGDWDSAAEVLAAAAEGLVAAGAELLLLATNTMHRIFPALEGEGRRWLHIADATGAALQRAGHQRVALLGTRFTMEEPFYCQRLQEQFGLDVMVPSVDQRREVDRVIFTELVHGAVHESSRRIYQGIISELGGAGATAVILGCTEIGMLITKADSSLPVFDTTVHHAHAAVDWLCEPAQDPRSAPPRQPRKKH